MTSESRKVATGLAFLAPNIMGFLAFTLFPLILSFVMGICGAQLCTLDETVKWRDLIPLAPTAISDRVSLLLAAELEAL